MSNKKKFDDPYSLDYVDMELFDDFRRTLIYCHPAFYPYLYTPAEINSLTNNNYLLDYLQRGSPALTEEHESYENTEEENHCCVGENYTKQTKPQNLQTQSDEQRAKKRRTVHQNEPSELPLSADIEKQSRLTSEADVCLPRGSHEISMNSMDACTYHRNTPPLLDKCLPSPNSLEQIHPRRYAHIPTLGLPEMSSISPSCSSYPENIAQTQPLDLSLSNRVDSNRKACFGSSQYDEVIDISDEEDYIPTLAHYW